MKALLLNLRKIPAFSDMFWPAKISFSSFDVSLDTSLSEKTDFISPKFKSGKAEVLRKLSFSTNNRRRSIRI